MRKTNIGLIVLGVTACACSCNAMAYDFFDDWPTRIKTDSGYEFGIKGYYQGDINDFSGGTNDPFTSANLFVDSMTWRTKEFDVYGKAPFGLEIELGHDWVNGWVDNYFKYSSDKAGNFRLGQFKTQVGWESTESVSAGTFLEHSLPDVATYEGRRLGFDWTYDKIPDWLISAAFYTGGDLDGNNNGHGYAGRAVYSPIHTDTAVVHLGIAASREYPNDHTAQFSSPPEAGLTKTHLVNTGTLSDTRSIDRTGFEAGWMRGPFYAQGEYLHLDAHRSNGMPDFVGDGFYVFGTWMLTGESRVYKDSYFVNVKPAHHYGAVELALRYSELDLNDGVIQGGKEHNYDLGLNWYLGQHLKLQTDYVWAKANDSPANAYLTPVDPRIFEMRAQLSF